MRPEEPRSHQLRPIFYVLGAVLLSYLLIENFERLSRVVFVIVDDMEAGLAGAGWRHSGFSAYFKYADYFARFERRGFFYVTGVFFVLPYVFEHQFLRPLLLAGVQLLTFAALAFYVCRRTAGYV